MSFLGLLGIVVKLTLFVVGSDTTSHHGVEESLLPQEVQDLRHMLRLAEGDVLDQYSF